MGEIVQVYTDCKKHRHDIFKSRAERDAVVKELRRDGWTVEVSSTHIDGESWYLYEATREEGKR